MLIIQVPGLSVHQWDSQDTDAGDSWQQMPPFKLLYQFEGYAHLCVISNGHAHTTKPQNTFFYVYSRDVV